MKPNIEIPDRLYKYRAFSDLTVQALVSDQLFFADPSQFNDPLDARPILRSDLKVCELEELLRDLVTARVTAEMEAAAQSLKIKISTAKEHIEKLSLHEAEKIIGRICLMSEERSKHRERDQISMLKHDIREELLKTYSDGVFCLAEKSDCPLMWSHYGDQHKGICLGYSVPEAAISKVSKVAYDKNRVVVVRDIAAMLAGNDEAKQRVDRAVRFWKASEWKYEKEWRVIGDRGLAKNILELDEIIFGLRCDDGVKFSFIQAMKRRSRKVEFYEIKENGRSSKLKKNKLDVDGFAPSFPVRSHDLSEWFKNPTF